MPFSQVMQTIEARLRALDEWAEENGLEAREQQLHLDDGSQERTYWHLGYLAALSDTSKLLATAAPNNEDKSTPHRAA